MNTQLDWNMRQHLFLFKGATHSVLTCLLLHANQRNRAFPASETIAEETGYGLNSVNTALRSLVKLKAVTNVTFKDRVGVEKGLPKAKKIYQLTGVYLFEGELYPYLHTNPETLQTMMTECGLVEPEYVYSDLLKSNLLKIKPKGSIEDKSLTEIKPTPEKPLPDKCVVERRCANCQGMKAFKDGDRFTCCGCGQLFGKDGPTPPHPAPAKEPSAHKQLERALLDGLGWQPGDMSGDDFARLGAAVKSLLKKGAPPSNGDIGDFFDWDKKTFEDGYRATTGQSVVGKWARFRAAQRKAETKRDDKPEMMVG